ncbi:hypothetical protein LEMLEM_LOCUS16588 [Lemmus lemmus]
MHPLLGV